MKFLLVLFLATVALAEEERHCYKEISEVCRTRGSAFLEGSASTCDSKYLSFENDVVLNGLERYAFKHLANSYDHLLTAANFGNYNKNREGFQKYFQKLSDSTWEKTIDIIKYVNKRGGMFKLVAHKEQTNKDTSYEEFELGSMANALGMAKDLAITANHIHHEVGRNPERYDAEVSSFIEKEFVHEHSSLVRELSGHTNDLKKLYSNDNDISLSLFLFDEYLKE